MRTNVTTLLALALILIGGVWLWSQVTDEPGQPTPENPIVGRTAPGPNRDQTSPNSAENSAGDAPDSAASESPIREIESAPLLPGQSALQVLWACPAPQLHATCLGTNWPEVERKQSVTLSVNQGRSIKAPDNPCSPNRGPFLIPLTPAFAATPQEAAPGSERLMVSASPTEPVGVLIIGATGANIATCELEVRCLANTDTPGLSVGFVLRRVVNAGEELFLPAFEGHAQIIARSNDLAGTWAGSLRLNHNKPIEIQLGPAFPLAGYINQVPGDEDLTSYGISVRPKGNLPNSAIAKCGVDKNGFWDLGEIHAAPGSELLVAAEGGSMLPQAKQILAPAAGTMMTVNFSWKAGLPAQVHVVDMQDTPLRGVEVQGFWYDPEEAAYTMVNARTDSLGIAVFPAMLVGEISFALREPAWSGMQYDYIHPKANNEPYTLQVSPASILKGTVRRNGQPVSDFQLAFINQRQHTAWKWFRNRSDGSFMIVDAPSGPVSVIVYSLDWDETSQAHDMTIPAGSTRNLDIELEANTHAHGQVVSADTGKPIEEAWIATKDPLGQILIDVERDYTITGPDGRFEDLPLAPSSSWVYVSAHGFQPSAFAAGGTDVDLDLGRIKLNAAGTLTLRLEPPPGNEIWTLVEAGRPQVTPDGKLVLHNRGAGLQSFRFEPPWGAYVDFFVTPRGSPPWDVVLHRPQGRKVVLVMEAEDGGPFVPDSVQALRVSWSDSMDGTSTLLTTYVDQETGEATIEGVPRSWISVAVIANSTDFSHVELDARAPGDLRLNIRPTTSSGRVRFIGTNGHSTSNVAAHFQLNEGVRARFEATDPEGTANLAGATGLVRYLISDPTQESLFTGTIEVPRGNTQEIPETIDSSHNLAVHFTDRGAPASYLTAMVTPVGWGGSYQVKITSDQEGNSPAHACSPGEYRVTPINAAYWQEPLTFHSSASGPAQVEVRRVGDLGIRAIQAGEPLIGITIQLHNTERDTDVSTWVTAHRINAYPTTDLDGRTIIRGIPSGLYTIQAQLPSGLVSVQAQVIGGTETWVSLGSQ